MQIKLSRIFLSGILSGILIAQAMVITGCPLTTALQKVERQLPVLEGIVATIVDFAAPEYAPAVKFTTGEVNAALAELNTILAGYKSGLAAAPQTVLSRIEALVGTIRFNLPGILPAFHVADAETIKYIHAFVDAANTVLLQIGALLPVGAASSPNLAAIHAQAKAQATPVKILTAQDLANQFNAAQNKIKVDQRGKVTWR